MPGLSGDGIHLRLAGIRSIAELFPKPEVASAARYATRSYPADARRPMAPAAPSAGATIAS